MSSSVEAVKLTEGEAEQYDRQIRLWGLEAQKRLRCSSLLVVGMRGLAAEVSKNIVLAGVRSVAVLDHRPLGPEDAGCRFLAFRPGDNRAEQAVSHLQSLNPNVSFSADVGNVEDKDDDYFKGYTAVCATCCSTDTMLRLDRICRENGVMFFCGDVWGYYGYFFTDLGEHTYAVDVAKEEEADEEGGVVVIGEPRPKRRKANSDVTTVTVKKTCSFCSLSDALSVDWSKKNPKYFKRTPATFFTIQTLQLFRDRFGRDPTLSTSAASNDAEALLTLKEEVADKYGVAKDLAKDEFTSHCFSELSPVCAIVGGVLAQEMIKALSAKDCPYRNSFLYDGVNDTGIVEILAP